MRATRSFAFIVRPDQRTHTADGGLPGHPPERWPTRLARDGRHAPPSHAPRPNAATSCARPGRAHRSAGSPRPRPGCTLSRARGPRRLIREIVRRTVYLLEHIMPAKRRLSYVQMIRFSALCILASAENRSIPLCYFMRLPAEMLLRYIRFSALFLAHINDGMKKHTAHGPI